MKTDQQQIENLFERSLQLETQRQQASIDRSRQNLVLNRLCL